MDDAAAGLKSSKAQRRRRATLADIVRGFGVEPDAIRFVARRSNVHWRVTSGPVVYALRRFGTWGRTTPGDVDWEVAAVEAYATAGAPVPRPIAPPRVVDDEIYLMMPWLGGRVLRHPPVSEGEYLRLGALLAEHHLATAAMATPAQRPGCGESARGGAPQIGGAERRGELLAALARVDPDAAGRFRVAAEAQAARDLPGRAGRLPAGGCCTATSRPGTSRSPAGAWLACSTSTAPTSMSAPTTWRRRGAAIMTRSSRAIAA